jgi:hypothetical protein
MNNLDNLLATEMQHEELNSLMIETGLFNNNNITDISNIIGASIGLDIMRNTIEYDINQLESNNGSQDNEINRNDNYENNDELLESNEFQVNKSLEDNQSLQDEDNQSLENEDNQSVENEDNQSLVNEDNQSLENEDNQSLEDENIFNSLNDNYQNVDNSFMRFYQSMMEFAAEGQNAFDNNPQSIPAQIYESIFNFTPEWRNLNRGANSHMRSNQMWNDINQTNLFQNPQNSNRYNQSDNSIGNILFNMINSGISNAQRNEFQNMFLNEMNPIPITLDTDVLNSFELNKYSDIKEKENDYRLCPICLIEHEDEDVVRILKCKHFFHKSCIDEWLNKHSYKCPICRCELGNSHANM